MPFSISALAIHPVKSASSIAVAQAEVTLRGFAHDRRYMLVDADGQFLTQRQWPILSQLTVALDPPPKPGTMPNANDATHFVLSTPGMSEPLRIPAGGPANGQLPQRVRVWNDVCDAVTLGPEVAEWVSTWLGFRADLAYMPTTSIRPTDPDFSHPGDHVSFADGFPFLLATEASLADLNARLTAPVEMTRFRPNLVVAGTDPFAEDRWRAIKIGGIVFRVAKSCGRCVLTTIDPKTGEKGAEPLKTLSTFRHRNGKVLFGVNLIAESSGWIGLGAPVEILA